MNEAALTGESIPQLKENLSIDEDTKASRLDMKVRNKNNILFGGTRMLQHSPAITGSTLIPLNVPPAPDNGCLCYVLRTGFASSQVLTLLVSLDEMAVDVL